MHFSSCHQLNYYLFVNLIAAFFVGLMSTFSTLLSMCDVNCKGKHADFISGVQNQGYLLEPYTFSLLAHFL